MQSISQGDCATQNPAPKGAKWAVGPGLVYSVTKGQPEYNLTPQAAARRLKTLRRSVVTTARLHEQALANQAKRHKVVMITLTYADLDGWQANHVKEFLRHVRRYLQSKGIAFRYTWVAELQKRGALHYHILVWLPMGITLPKPDKRGWWVHGSTRVEFAQKAVSYIAKYASKIESKGGDFPKGVRLHGFGGLVLQDRHERAWWSLPQYIRPTSPDYRETGPTKRASGGGWVTPDGEWIPSRYKMIFFDYVAPYLAELENWADIIQPFNQTNEVTPCAHA